MSSSEGDSGIEHHVEKARNIQRACDVCRRKKVRCDGSQMPKNRCTNCVVSNFDCTYVEAAKKRGPPKSYVQSLEHRVAKLQQLLAKISPEALDRLDDSDTPLGHAHQTMPPSNIPSRPATIPFIHSIMDTPPSTPPPDNKYESVLEDNLQDLSLGSTNRFFGKSSEVMFHRATLRLKHNYLSDSVTNFRPEPPLYAHPSDPTLTPYVFPEEDLLHSLIELYFTHLNTFYPLFHRPTFDKSVEEGLHLSNEPFAENVLLVCAVASRYSNDPRVLLNDRTHSRGWKWFSQMQGIRKSMIRGSTVDDLRFCFFSAMFLQGSSVPQASWLLASLGLRLAQDMGAHRRKTHNSVPTPEDESLKRVFWGLILFDRKISALLGRPCAMQDEDYDIDLPIECDDEYWYHPDPQKRFKQPADKPSIITYFVLMIKLYKILAFALRTIYAVNKSKILLGFADRQWEESIVGELDTALNKFIDSVPNHLRWDPNKEDETFFEQSAALYSAYYHVQIVAHRPFISSPSRPIPLSFPSVAICTNAARSCSRLAAAQLRRSAVIPPTLQSSVFLSGVILLLNMWSGKHSGFTTDPRKDMEDVHKCMDVLKASETSWYIAGRLWDILCGLASAGDRSLPKGVSSTNKRERDEDETPPLQVPTPILSPTTSIAESLAMPRNIARPGRPGNSNSPVGTVPATNSHPLQEPRIQEHQYSAPSQRSLSQSQRLQAPQGSSQHIGRPPQPTHQIYGVPLDSTEIDQLPLHHPPKVSDLQRETPLHSAYGQSWYRHPTDDKGDDMSSTVNSEGQLGSTMANLQVYPSVSNLRAMPLYNIHDSLPDDAIPMQYSSDPFAHSLDDYQNYHYPSMGANTAVDCVVQQDPPIHPGYVAHGQPAVPQQGVRVNEAYGMWSDVPSNLEFDAWENHISLAHVNSMAYGPVREHSR